MAACNHHGTQSGPMSSNVFSIMAHYKQDDRNTGCTTTYYYIQHLHLHSVSQETRQDHFEKETQISQTNETQKDLEQKSKFRKQRSKKGNTQTHHHEQYKSKYINEIKE